MLERELRSYEARLRKLSRQITHADLTAAANGAAQSLSLGSLPYGGVISGRSVVLTTYFTGGSASAATLALGVASDVDSLMAALNVLDTTTLAIPLQGTAGVSPLGAYGGMELLATFAPDGGHTLLALTAGSVLVEVYYSVPDAAA